MAARIPVAGPVGGAAGPADRRVEAVLEAVPGPLGADLPHPPEVAGAIRDGVLDALALGVRDGAQALAREVLVAGSGQAARRVEAVTGHRKPAPGVVGEVGQPPGAVADGADATLGVAGDAEDVRAAGLGRALADLGDAILPGDQRIDELEAWVGAARPVDRLEPPPGVEDVDEPAQAADAPVVDLDPYGPGNPLPVLDRVHLEPCSSRVDEAGAVVTELEAPAPVAPRRVVRRADLAVSRTACRR